MKLRTLLFFAIFWNVCLHAKEPEVIVFKQFWKAAKEQVYPVALVESHFTAFQYQRLKRKASLVSSISELTPHINHFLDTLNVSHTQFYDHHTIDFYLYRSMFASKDIDLPRTNHIGVQTAFVEGVYVVREVLDGYPAAKAGLRRGDQILTANEAPFHPYLSFNPASKNIQLEVNRNGKQLKLKLNSIYENPNRSYSQAIIHSAKIIEYENYKLGYLRLWAGTHKDNIHLFKQMIEQRLIDSDAIILDLRGGFGGAWYDYLDSFFFDRSNYYSFSIASRNGTSEFSPEPKVNVRYYSKPMVVLINQGTRSGKEALAFQFKKSQRATLVGMTTQGAFTAGKGIFNDSNYPYFLFLSTAEYQLDGIKIEGVGISPDIQIDYSLDKSLNKDPQREAALEEAVRLLRTHN